MKIDHLLWAVPHLAEAVEQFTSISGVRAKLGGQHPEHGTHNALLDIGNNQYLEIIAPDPNAQKPLDEALRQAAFSRPRLLTFVARSNNLEEVKQKVERQGFSAVGPYQSSREGDNEFLEWQLLSVEAHPLGFSMPTFIDWQKTPHPAASAPSGCEMRSFKVLSHTPDLVKNCYRDFGLDVEVVASPVPGALAVLETPNGTVVLS